MGQVKGGDTKTTSWAPKEKKEITNTMIDVRGNTLQKACLLTFLSARGRGFFLTSESSKTASLLWQWLALPLKDEMACSPASKISSPPSSFALGLFDSTGTDALEVIATRPDSSRRIYTPLAFFFFSLRPAHSTALY